MSQFPNNFTNGDKMEGKHLKYAIQLIELKKYKEALKQLQATFEINPPSPEIMILMATCYFKLGEDEKGIKLTESALALNPNDVYAHWLAGVHYLKEEDYASSEKYLKQAESIDPNDEKIKAGLSALYLVVGKDVESEKYINEALKQSPENPIILALKADNFNLEGNHHSALRYAKMALSKNPHDADIHHTAAEASIQLDDSSEAKYHLKEAIKLAPSNQEYRNNLVDYSLRRHGFLRIIYPDQIFLGLEDTVLYGGISMFYIILLIIGEIILNFFPKEVSFAISSITFFLLGIYLIAPYINRVIGSWITWGIKSYRISIKTLFCQLNLQFATWAFFICTKQGTETIAFSAGLFCLLYGFSFGLYDSCDKRDKVIISITHTLSYLLGIYAIYTKIQGEAVTKDFKIVLMIGCMIPFFLNPEALKKLKNNAK